MKQKILSRALLFVILFLIFDFVAKFAGPELLKSYIASGIGTCQQNPVLCIVPEQEKLHFTSDKAFQSTLVPFRMPGVELYAPRRFTVIKERIKKVYYKRQRRVHKGQSIYVLSQPPDFFLDLFPQYRARGIQDDHQFFSRVMHAQLSAIEGTSDAFFVVIKSLFTAGLGEEQSGVKIVEFEGEGKKGFIAYNKSAGVNYFDCNIFTQDRQFFKLFVRDESLELGLQDVLTIISTVRKIDE